MSKRRENNIRRRMSNIQTIPHPEQAAAVRPKSAIVTLFRMMLCAIIGLAIMAGAAYGWRFMDINGGVAAIIAYFGLMIIFLGIS